MSRELVERLVDVMRRSDPDFVQSHELEQVTDHEWDAVLADAEDWLEDARGAAGEGLASSGPGDWWPVQLAAPRWCPGPGGACAYCGKPESEHEPPERVCTGIDLAERQRRMGAALAAGARPRRVTE